MQSTAALNVGQTYARNETTLSPAGTGIHYAFDVVRGVEVNFAKRPYPDARLPNGCIRHIGEGKSSRGNQSLKLETLECKVQC
jgi:hypothetical protein